MKIIKISMVAVILLLKVGFYSHGQNNMGLTKLGEFVVATNAFNASTNSVAAQQSALVSHNGYQYATYWDVNKHLCIARRQLVSNKWSVITFTEYTSPHDLTDMHYFISMGVCTKDGTIHLSFDQHVTGLRYYRSNVGAAGSSTWTRSLFPTYHANYLISGQPMYDVTYPKFISMPSGDLLFEARRGGGSGNSDQYLYKYDGGKHTWASIGKYINGVSVSETAYLYGVDYDATGKMHITWCCRQTPDASTNHDLFYMYSTDHGKTWKNTSGTTVGTTGSNPVKANSSTVKVWSIPVNFGLLNQEGQAVDNEGRITIKVMHYKDGTTTVAPFVYYMDLSKKWHKQLINTTAGAGRSVIAYDNNQNCYVMLKKSGIPWIYGATRPSGITDWKLLNSGEIVTISGEGQVDKRRLKSDGVLSLFYMQSGNKAVVLEYKISTAKSAENFLPSELAVDQESGLTVSPNPVSGDFVDVDISLTSPSKVNITIIDVTGETVYRKELGNFDVGAMSAKINLSSLPKGNYVVLLWTKDGYKSSKLIRL